MLASLLPTLCCRSPSESSSESRSRSRSPSPGREEKITFITSFGGSDEEAAAAAAAAAASGATPGKPLAPPQPGGPTPGRNASARSVTLVGTQAGSRGWGVGSSSKGSGADGLVLPQPPLLLVLRLQDVQLSLQFALQLSVTPWLLPVWPPCALPLAFLVPLALPLPALFALPQSRKAALRRRFPRRTPLLALASPAWRVRASPQKQVRTRAPIWAGAGTGEAGWGQIALFQQAPIWKQDGVGAQNLGWGLIILQGHWARRCLLLLPGLSSLQDLGIWWVGL